MADSWKTTARGLSEMSGAQRYMDRAARCWLDGDQDRAQFWIDLAKAHPDADAVQERIEKAAQVMAGSPAIATEPNPKHRPAKETRAAIC